MAIMTADFCDFEYTTVFALMNTSVPCVDPEMYVDEACEILLDSNVRVGPVVDPEGKPVGVVSLRDLAGGFARHVEVDHRIGTRVADVMMCMVFHLPPTASLAQAAALMVYEEVSQIIIVDLDGTYCGVLSSDDIMRWIAAETGSLPRGDLWIETRMLMMGQGENLSGQNKSVLVIEDDSAISESVADVLEGEGYAAICTPNGRHALDVLDDMPSKPGLILLDLMMPEMNGWEFRRRQLQDPDLNEIPVVVLSAYGGSFGPVEFEQPAPFVRKPMQVEELLCAVANNYSAAN